MSRFDSSPEEYKRAIEVLVGHTAEEFRLCAATDQRKTACRYFHRGALAGFSTGELIDFLGVSASSVLDRAGYSDEAAQRVMDMVGTISDEEVQRLGGNSDA
jgi:hypothetical protein